MPAGSKIPKPGGIPKPVATTSGSGDETFKVGDRVSPKCHAADSFPVSILTSGLTFQVWVGGTKPGKIEFLGETKFAPGEWAGVVLDEAVGKNDGSVAGVSYFKVIK